MTQAVKDDLSCADLDRELVKRRRLSGFIRAAWREVEPGDFKGNWHIDAIAAHLQAVTDRELSRLVINIPPGCMKSLSVSVFWPAWVWTHRPSEKWLFASYAANLSRRDAARMRALVESEWFQERWGPLPLAEAQTSVTDFANVKGGFRYSTSPDGGATGRHADVQVADDPHKTQDVNSSAAIAKTHLDETREWWRTTMASRLLSENSARVVVMQRVHEGDLAGSLAEEGYTTLRLPMEYEPKAVSHTRWSKDPRTEEGELLWPERFPAERVATLKREVGARGFATQYQQRPAPMEGSIFKREWFQYWEKLPRGLTLYQSWDCKFKDTKTTGSYVAGQVWGASGSNFYLVDQVRERLGFADTCHAIRAMARKYPHARSVLVEDKANGPAIVETLKREIPGIVEVSPEGGKEARANAVEPLFEARQVYFPPPLTTPWLAEFEHEVATFPASANDDQVDAMTQALLHMRAKSTHTYLEAVRRMKSG